MEKAIVEKIIDAYTYKVRIPRLNKIASSNTAVDTDSLPSAKVCAIPGVTPAYQVGDIVFVEFDYQRYDLPIIIGLLCREEQSESILQIDKSKLIIDDTANNEVVFTNLDDKG